ncbi:MULTISPECIES: (S)-benzoin forming benzil reductase [Gracilibacillus]|uniref:(S)-benzoin forming benzil reductase n=1 Tax=Gracilibacillus TaxID=74385 RepID=UPI0008246897|nr:MULTISPECIES: (S)-benzoin forming benzil reductase [Gracilibacillus]
MKYAVVTGTSKGLGAAIARLFMQASIHVIGLARHENQDLANEDLPGQYHHVTVDLADLQQTEQKLQEVMDDLKTKPLQAVYLVQNAAVVTPIEQVGKQTSGELTRHVHVNLLSPMIITNLWLQGWRESDISCVIAHVTSGAANRSVYGWSAYGSSKAGLDRYTQTVALEQEQLGTGKKVLLFDPSIMDTDMQGEIRSSDESQFSDVQQFKDYKQHNQLRSTEKVARVLVDRLLKPEDLVNGQYLSVKELL